MAVQDMWRWHAPWRVVQAAGGVLCRRDRSGRPEVLIVHRPKYDDWTLPKGKLEPGETHAAAAVREVLEETGLRVRLGAELPATAYRDRHGRRKRVRYWQMDVVGGGFAPNREVDEVRWVDPETASRLLTYPRDRQVVDAIAADR
jgi:8-oxo-dGTP diphosphatase